ncbi:MAG: DUF362 domain-containing protein [Candidatus Bathyarchaeota archaeon]|nr:DUF362 domain-containing protein [Candidatus Bathyarchaeota archaeon]
MDSVALVKYKGDPEQSLQDGINFVDGFKTVKSPFIIKPNICIDVDKTGYANTRVEIVEALIKLALTRDEALSIRIVESDSESKYADEAFEKFGYKRLAEKLTDSGYDVAVVNLSHDPRVKVEFKGDYFADPELLEILLEAGYFVSLAVARTHGLTLITGVLKNLFGLLPKKGKRSYHPHINEVIIDVNRMVRSDLCIIDGRVGLEGWGGLEPKPVLRTINSLIIGRKPLSVDSTMARIMGFNPQIIRHLVLAEKFDLGTFSPEVLSESLESSVVPFDEPPSLRPTAKLSL